MPRVASRCCGRRRFEYAFILWRLGLETGTGLMTEVWMLVAVSAVAFVSTNIDNLLMLSALLAMSAVRPLPVVTGFLLTTVIVIGAALLIARLGDLVDTRYVGLLGLIPIALGLRGLLTLMRSNAGPATTQDVRPGCLAHRGRHPADER